MDPATPLALPTCELRAEDLRVVDDVLPELLKLRYPRDVLQEPHEVTADHEAVHELGKEEEKVSPGVYLLPSRGKALGGGGEGRNSQSFNLTAGSR